MAPLHGIGEVMEHEVAALELPLSRSLIAVASSWSDVVAVVVANVWLLLVTVVIDAISIALSEIFVTRGPIDFCCSMAMAVRVSGVEEGADCFFSASETVSGIEF